MHIRSTLSHSLAFPPLGLLLAGLLLGCAGVGAEKPDASFRDCADCPEMVVVPGGKFLMGSPASDAIREADEQPAHEVTVKPLAIGKFEITEGEYRQFAEATGKGGQDWKLFDMQRAVYDRNAVLWVSWLDAQDYVQWLSARTGRQYRLLTEAEWEHAARAEEAGLYEPFDTQEAAHDLTGPLDVNIVGMHHPNAYGLYDMTGNVPEWTEDCYLPDYASAAADGSAAEGDCKQRVVRGASNFSDRALKRVANRDWGYAVNRSAGNPTGFRIARPLD
jgi:formylglycine-generating enzyme required for sulfatase activity